MYPFLLRPVEKRSEVTSFRVFGLIRSIIPVSLQYIVSLNDTLWLHPFAIVVRLHLTAHLLFVLFGQKLHRFLV